jgi:NAD(P)-dependent dehydrogenase (short-subunit alcohol dehydrogenase family)
VLITGAEGGIGRAIAAGFRVAGYRVIGIDVEQNHDSEVDAYVSADLNALVENETLRRHTISNIKKRFLNHSLHALVNNAAIQRIGAFLELTDRDWRETLNVNLLAPLILTREFFGELSGAHGSVVNVCSIHGSATKPDFSSYATSKAALAGLTRSLAVECGERVRINAIAPAAIDTPMLRAGFTSDDSELNSLSRFHPIGRIGTPEDVAALCVFLCSSQAGFINGALIGLDGGIAARLHDPS